MVPTYIGATRQINKPKAGWIDFFRENRLATQMKMADHYF
ncbi:fructosamine kinase family protein [Selenomonas sp. KH1T6]